jgi:hypothetical protein
MTPMTERIVSVAIRMYTAAGETLLVTIPAPARHHTVLHPLYTINKVIVRPEDQGFLTSTGRFVGRIEAAEIALATQQIRKLMSGPELYSEDVW